MVGAVSSLLCLLAGLNSRGSECCKLVHTHGTAGEQLGLENAGRREA
jgi:hypothetical protein